MFNKIPFSCNLIFHDINILKKFEYSCFKVFCFFLIFATVTIFFHELFELFLKLFLKLLKFLLDIFTSFIFHKLLGAIGVSNNKIEDEEFDIVLRNLLDVLYNDEKFKKRASDN